jgi:phage tail-like protein
MIMEEFSLTPSYYFEIDIGDDTTAHFQEVNGLEVSLEVEEVIEGGNNIFKHRLPVRQAYGNLALRKGIVSQDDAFHNWVKELLLRQESMDNTFGDKLKDLIIRLKSPVNGETAVAWKVINAYPVKWSVSSLNSTDNKVMIETVDFAFQYLHEDSENE